MSQSSSSRSSRSGLEEGTTTGVGESLNETECYYEILEVSRRANDSEIRKAYRKKALQYHPDKATNDSTQATRNFQLVSEAYQVLSDPVKRQEYDSFGRGGRRSSSSNNHGHHPRQDFNSHFHHHFKTADELFKQFFGGSLNDPFNNNDPFFFTQHSTSSSSRSFDPFDDPFFTNSRQGLNMHHNIHQQHLNNSIHNNHHHNTMFNHDVFGDIQHGHHQSSMMSGFTSGGLSGFGSGGGGGQSVSTSTRIVNGKVEKVKTIVDSQGNETVEVTKGVQGGPMTTQVFVNGIEDLSRGSGNLLAS